MTRDEKEWAVQAFIAISKEWANQVNWEAARGIKQPSDRAKRLESLLRSAPTPVIREVLRRNDAL